jgi:hypothetical protein
MTHDKVLPIVRHIREVYSFEDPNSYDHNGCVVLIAWDPMSGKAPHRYSVLRIDYQTGETIVIGRELPLQHARQIAKNQQQPGWVRGRKKIE